MNADNINDPNFNRNINTHNTKINKKIISFYMNLLNSKLRLTLLVSILFISWILTLLIKANVVNASQIQEGIAHEIIRFHVIANSDSIEDQELKYKIKDVLVKEMTPYLKDAKSINEGRNIIKSRLVFIQEKTKELILREGYNYQVSVSLEKTYFPMKIYGEYTFPPGIYEALKVKIGAARGKNWWCVMFPPLCFVDETYSIVDEGTDRQLKYLLDEEEYATLRDQKTPVKVKFKLWESIKKLFKS
ncbi:stage II sporulation protein R [Mobilitalea sibirica]|uniref:Stage II sporulation protein R n=1 Tax=Mobilitalea sibirica TaxID=1462919 RepID=A0A8J7HDH6_9FIRM|nr:stage II sporulation protein R [Mobilitalea sibirica]MBH1942067.1 stage II sporulation protein R [Mobilitalea sibirica]